MPLSELDLSALLVIAFAYFLAGISKGAVGFGIPMIAIPLVASILPVPLAIALTCVPILSSNAVQAIGTVHPATVLRRFWPLLVCMVPGTVLGAQILTRVDLGTISIIVGCLLVVFVALQGFDYRPQVSGAAERWLNPVVGFISGLLGGVTGMLGPLLLILLVSLRLSRDAFVGTIAMFYFTGIIPLYVTLVASGIIDWDEMIVSTLACVPLFGGIRFGAWLRGRVSQTGFLRLLLVMIFLVGLNLIRRGF